MLLNDYLSPQFVHFSVDRLRIDLSKIRRIKAYLTFDKIKIFKTGFVFLIFTKLYLELTPLKCFKPED